MSFTVDKLTNAREYRGHVIGKFRGQWHVFIRDGSELRNFVRERTLAGAQGRLDAVIVDENGRYPSGRYALPGCGIRGR